MTSLREEKLCSDCDEWKAEDMFSGNRNTCRACRKVTKDLHYETYRDEINARRRAKYAKSRNGNKQLTPPQGRGIIHIRA